MHEKLEYGTPVSHLSFKTVFAGVVLSMWDNVTGPTNCHVRKYLSSPALGAPAMHAIESSGVKPIGRLFRGAHLHLTLSRYAATSMPTYRSGWGPTQWDPSFKVFSISYRCAHLMARSAALHVVDSYAPRC